MKAQKKNRKSELLNENARKCYPLAADRGEGPQTLHEDLDAEACRDNRRILIEDSPDLIGTSEAVFEALERAGIAASDRSPDVPGPTLEAKVGYSPLLRQFERAFVRQVAFFRSKAGGGCSMNEARKRALHSCKDLKEAKDLFSRLAATSFESLRLVDLLALYEIAPKVAEGFWEMIKYEGRKEFESGHLSTHHAFPVGSVKEVWHVARYLGVRESFIAEFQPRGGIELSLIDMLTQSYFQWQYWLEQTLKRTESKPRQMHPRYVAWLDQLEKENRDHGWTEGYWFQPTLSEHQALEQAFLMVDRWNRIYMRTLRQLRDLRRYSPVTINNANQINIAAEGGQQVNLAE